MNDYTATLRGLTIGAGTDYRWASWPAGLLDTAPIRAADFARPGGNGSVAGSDFYGPRTVTFEVEILGDGRADAELLLAELREAFARDNADEWLDVRITGTPMEYALVGRPRGVAAAIGRRFTGGANIQARCSFVATDPLIYGPITSEEIGVSAHTIPATLPFTLGIYGEEAVVNAGSAATERWTVTFEAPSGGPIVNPRILHVGTGQQVRVDRSVPANNQLVLDGYVGRGVIGVVSTSIVPTSISQWFALAPGTNTLRFSADDGTHLSSTATVAWRPAWE